MLTCLCKDSMSHKMQKRLHWSFSAYCCEFLYSVSIHNAQRISSCCPMTPNSKFLLPAVQNPLLYLSINSPARYSKTNNSNFHWNLSQNNHRPSMSTTPRPNQHQMSPEPFLFSPLTSLFFVSLALSCLEFHIPCGWGYVTMVVVWAPCRTLLLMIYSVGSPYMLRLVRTEKWASLYFKHCYAQFPLEVSQTREEMRWVDSLFTSLTLSTLCMTQYEHFFKLWGVRVSALAKETANRPLQPTHGTPPVDTLHSHRSLHQREKTNLLFHLSAVRKLLACSD